MKEPHRAILSSIAEHVFTYYYTQLHSTLANHFYSSRSAPVSCRNGETRPLWIFDIRLESESTPPPSTSHCHTVNLALDSNYSVCIL